MKALLELPFTFAACETSVALGEESIGLPQGGRIGSDKAAVASSSIGTRASSCRSFPRCLMVL